jgi:hypothetical protein
MAVSN